MGPHRVINVEPSIHLVTGRIAFSSDRSGKTMIYSMNARGEDIKQLTYEGNHNANPDWSPVRSRLAFPLNLKGVLIFFLWMKREEILKGLPL